MFSNLSKRVSASAVEPAKPASTWPPRSWRILRALCFITTSPMVTWPSPAIATSRPRRTASTVVACSSPVTRCVMVFSAFLRFTFRVRTHHADVAQAGACTRRGSGASAEPSTVVTCPAGLQTGGATRRGSRATSAVGGATRRGPRARRLGRRLLAHRAGSPRARHPLAVAGAICARAGRAACPRASLTGATGLRCAMADNHRRAFQRPTHLRTTLHASRLGAPVAQCQQAATLRARHGQRAIPYRERARRVVGAAIEHLGRLARLALHQVAAAVRADGARLDHERLLEVAFREARARDEAAKAAGTNYKTLATATARLVALF